MFVARNLRWLAAMVLLGMGGAACAVPMTWQDEIDFTPKVKLNSGNNRHGFIHDIRGDGFQAGRDSVVSAVLTVSLKDDLDRRRQHEFAWINLPGWRSDRIFEVDFFDVSIGLKGRALVKLDSTGFLRLSVRRLVGDFFLTGSKLTVRGKSAVQVTEPNVVALIGIALLAPMVLAARRRRPVLARHA